MDKEFFELHLFHGKIDTKACRLSHAEFQLVITACIYQAVKHESPTRKKDYSILVKKFNKLKWE